MSHDNEQCFDTFRESGGVTALRAAMNAVLDRVRRTAIEEEV
jgi:hypothetical protein